MARVLILAKCIPLIILIVNMNNVRAMQKDLQNLKVIDSYPGEFSEQQVIKTGAEATQPPVLPELPDAVEQKTADSNLTQTVVSTASQAYGSFHALRNCEASHAKYLQHCWSVIASNKNLIESYNTNNEKMYKEVDVVWDLLQRCINGKSLSERMIALIKFSQHNVGLSSTLFNDAFQKMLSQLYSSYFNKEGFLHNNVLGSAPIKGEKIIKEFSEDLLKCVNAHENYLMKRIVEYATNKAMPEGVSQTQLKNNEFQKKIAQNPLFKDLYSVLVACNSQQWESALTNLKKYENGLFEYKLLSTIYNEYYTALFNEQGVDRKYISDPILKKYELESSSIPNKELNELLALRDKRFHALLSHFSINSPTAKIREMLYELVDVAQEEPTVLCDRLSELVSKEDVNAQTYDAFYNSNGWLPKGYVSNKTLLEGFTVPDTIKKPAHAKERSLLFRFANYNTHGNKDLEKAAKLGISYVIKACADSQHANAYRSLALAVDKALMNKNVDSTIVQCGNLSRFSPDGKALISGAGIEFVAKAVDMLQNSVDLSVMERSKIQAALYGLDGLCNTAAVGKKIAIDSVWTALKPLFDNSAHIDSDMLKTLGADKVNILVSDTAAAARYALDACLIEKPNSSSVKKFVEHITNGLETKSEEWRAELAKWQKEIAELPIKADDDIVGKYEIIGLLEAGRKVLAWEIGALSFLKDPMGKAKEWSSDIAKNILIGALFFAENSPFSAKDNWDFTLQDPLSVKLPRRPITEAFLNSLIAFAKAPADEKVKGIVNAGLDMLALKYTSDAMVSLIKSGLISQGGLLDANTIFFESEKGAVAKNVTVREAAGLLAEAQMKMETLIAQGGDKAIWTRMRATQPLWENTHIPRSFITKIGEKDFWISGNVTEHFYEWLKKPNSSYTWTKECIPANQTILAQEVILREFFDDLELIANQPIVYNTPIEAGNWVVVFREAEIAGQCPRIVHIEHASFANYTGTKKI